MLLAIYMVKNLKSSGKAIMRRDDYKLKNKNEISNQNEPCGKKYIDSEYKKYPDMYSVYNKFAELYNRNDFILTNGCENALRIAILALRPDLVKIEYPTWGLVEVICSSLDIKTKRYYFNDNFIPEETSGCVYMTDEYNNFFKHSNLDIDKHSIYIIDETYTHNYLLNKKTIKDNIIVIGSFSKVAGAGLRLGYVLFSNNLRGKLNMLREQYVSSLAADYILSLDEPPRFCFDNIDYQDNKYIAVHDVYKSMTTKPEHDNYKVATLISGKKIYREGV